MSRILRIILFVILVLLLLLIGFRCSQQAPEGGPAGLLDGAKQAADTVAETAKTGTDTVGDATEKAMDAVKTGADAMSDTAKSGMDAVSDAADTTLDAAKTGAGSMAASMESASGDSLSATAHAVIADGIKAVVTWAKSTPSTADGDSTPDTSTDKAPEANTDSTPETSAPETGDTTESATASTQTATAVVAAAATSSTDADSLNATAHSVIADGINAVAAWASSGGTVPETTPDSDTSASAAPASTTPNKTETTTAPAPEKVATTEVSAETMSAGSSIRLDGVNFASGSDRLIGDSKSILDNVAKILSEKGDVNVEVAGYTDSTGNAAFNKSLSQLRAAKVKAYLASKGVNAEHMTAVGHGQESPIADNATAAGRKANRRVELHVR